MGLQDALGQGPDLRGLPRAGVLLALRDPAQQHRDADGRRLRRPPGPGADGRLRAARRSLGRRPAAGVDDDAVDAAGQPRPRRRRGHHLRRRRARRPAPRPRRRPPGCVRAPSSATSSRWRPCAATSSPVPAYRPLFDFFTDAERFATERAFQVLTGDFVSTDEGTGIVHMAPGFGEDDQIACNAVGIPTLVPMDEHGRYTGEVPDWAGEHVFEANPHIIRRLKDDGVVAAPRDLRPPVPALLAVRAAARLPGDLIVVRRGHQVPRSHGRAQRPDHLGARAPQARQLRQVVGERPRLVDQSQPLLGLTDPGVAQRRPRAPAGRRLRLTRRAGGRLRCEGDRSAPPDGRRARPSQPRRPDRPLDDAPRDRGARLLVRVGLDAVRPGALPVREPRLVRGPLPGRLHRRVHRPDPRLVLHAARAGHGAVRPSGVQDVRQPRHRPRLGQPEDVQEPAQLPRSDGGVRLPRCRRHALVPALVADPARQRLLGHRDRPARHRPTGPPAAVERVVLPRPLRQRRRVPGPGRRSRPAVTPTMCSTATSSPRAVASSRR